MTTPPLDLAAVRESYCITDRDLQGEPLTAWRCALARVVAELEEARAELRVFELAKEGED